MSYFCIKKDNIYIKLDTENMVCVIVITRIIIALILLLLTMSLCDAVPPIDYDIDIAVQSKILERRLRMASSSLPGDEDLDGWTTLNVGVLMASHLDSPFDLERCGPAVDLALERVNKEFLQAHRVRLNKVQARWVYAIRFFFQP